ncbi:MAG: hypothetical protein A2Z24_00960 [Candidatus Woykebacteria bacterium RBG_16_44_10]|uniref:Type-4 uracil-DNA glycosylase n=1 Tax=Candidatus Woykebacteria bacterium RBG_16_44_10 TaxID=1802597 RepID=A0A1G1WD92_9BACT|nr:MAG: hypothetical protein A2Z24_00960 [Candidatus Woykebacteria bacterium RBG_16_44_10]
MTRTEDLATLTREIEKCTRCDLYKGATHAVAGEGSSSTKIVFVGEAPGYHEDSQGRPFVGNAGKLLDLLLSKVGLRREEVFITNMLKHRPPENRDPEPYEIAACNIWLEKQLALLQPKIVVTLGKWSLNHYLPTKKISEVHGKSIRVQGVVVLPMYHPAAALRSTNIARELENDFLKNKELLQNPQKADEMTGLSEESGQGSLF